MRRQIKANALAGYAVLGAVALGCVLGLFDLGRARQLLRAPYIEHVPGGLLAAFVMLAVVGVAVAAVLYSRLVPRHHGWRGPALAVVVSAGAVASVWGGLYSTAVVNPIPVLDWAFYAVPVALAGLLARGTAVDPLGLGLLAAVPVAAVNTLGWAVSTGVSGGIVMAAFSGGMGLVVGLGLGFLLAGPTMRPATG
jgi:hypothetical protein